MNRVTEAPQTAEPPQITESMLESTEAGQRLDRAQSADHAWRTNMLLDLYRRLLWLRRFDRVVQYTGAGVGSLLLVAAFFAFFGDAATPDADGLVRRVLSLIVGAMAASGSGLILVSVVGSCQARIRRWIAQTGLVEHLEELDDTGAAAEDLRASPRGTGIYIKTERFFAAVGWAVILFMSFRFFEALLTTTPPK